MEGKTTVPGTVKRLRRVNTALASTEQMVTRKARIKAVVEVRSCLVSKVYKALGKKAPAREFTK